MQYATWKTWLSWMQNKSGDTLSHLYKNKPLNEVSKSARKFGAKKSVKEDAQAGLNFFIAKAVFDTDMARLTSGQSQFIPNCLKHLKENKDRMF